VFPFGVKQWLACACLASAGLTLAATAAARDAGAVAQRSCAALGRRVDEVPGREPLLLRSYDDAGGAGEPAQPPLKTAAFSYDNALAVIALLACDRRAEAVRVGEALRRAALDKRLRNAYRAGVVAVKPLPNGWWDAANARWAEDPYQAGTATGNVAWTALALLALDDATADRRWREAAEALARWAAANAADDRRDGFTGGVEGFDADARELAWKSTEHNIDLAALFAWLDGPAPARWRADAQRARRFVDTQWDRASGHFFVGTLPDGTTPNRTTSALDVQLWAQLLPDAPAEWRSALAYVEREHRVAGGFDFNADRDGLWLEGTAQAALIYRLWGRDREAAALLATIAGQFARGGYVYATREPRISTGLALGSASATADFYYFRRPHLAATAWAALAATGRNPFVAPHRNAARRGNTGGR
jgi:hypothetical protein